MSSIVMMMADASGNIINGSGAACSVYCNITNLGVSFKTIANTLTFLVGAVSVIMVIVGGLRYATSQGDSKAIASAKDTILYAIIGVGVAVAAFGVINFVATALK